LTNVKSLTCRYLLFGVSTIRDRALDPVSYVSHDPTAHDFSRRTNNLVDCLGIMSTIIFRGIDHRTVIRFAGKIS
jgi:hypothetical protein